MVGTSHVVRLCLQNDAVTSFIAEIEETTVIRRVLFLVSIIDLLEAPLLGMVGMFLPWEGFVSDFLNVFRDRAL